MQPLLPPARTRLLSIPFPMRTRLLSCGLFGSKASSPCFWCPACAQIQYIVPKHTTIFACMLTFAVLHYLEVDAQNAPDWIIVENMMRAANNFNRLHISSPFYANLGQSTLFRTTCLPSPVSPLPSPLSRGPCPVSPLPSPLALLF